MYTEIFLTALVIGAIPGLIAQSKGRNFFTWYIYGVLIFIIALVHSLVISNSTKDLKKCPKCAELVKEEANICRHCRFEFQQK